MDTEEDDQPLFSSLCKELEGILKSTESAIQTLDLLKQTFEEELFHFSETLIRVKDTYEPMKRLCMQSGLFLSCFTVDAFLRALNRWLVATKQVNINTMDILPNEITQNAFQIGPEPIHYLTFISIFPSFFEEAKY